MRLIAPAAPIFPAAKQAAAQLRKIADLIDAGQCSAMVIVYATDCYSVNHGHGSIADNIVLATILHRKCVDRLHDELNCGQIK